MQTVYLYQGPPSSGKTERMVREVVRLHQETGPFSYLWLGPSGGSIRQIREQLLIYINGLFPEQLRVVDQYTVETLNRIEPNRFFIDRDFLSALITDLITDDSYLFELLKRGKGILQQFVDFYFLFQEQKDIEQLKAEIDGSEDQTLRDFKGLFEKLESRLEKLQVYTITHGYYHLSDLLRTEKEFFQALYRPIRALFIDGFLDLPHPIQEMIGAMAHYIPYIHLSIPMESANEYADPSWEHFTKKLTIHYPVTKVERRSHAYFPKKSTPVARFAHSIHSGRTTSPSAFRETIRVHTFESPAVEVQWICCKIKDSLLEEALEPDDIGIVIRNPSVYLPLFEKEMEEMGIPWRSDQNLPILESVTVHRLILPFMAFGRGFPSDLLLMIMDSGLVKPPALSLGDRERIVRDAGLDYSSTNPFPFKDYPKGLKERKNEWERKIRSFHSFTEQRIESAKYSEDYDEIAAELQDRLNQIEQFRLGISHLFSLLESCFAQQVQQPVQAYRIIFEGFLESLERSKMLSYEEKEETAIRFFFDHILSKIERLCHIAHKKSAGAVNPVTFWFYLKTILDHSGFPPSMKMDNRVRMMDLQSSRFRQHKLRFYPGMVHQDYPKIPFQSMLFHDTVFGSDNRQRILDREERDFWSSVRQVHSTAFFSYPLGDITGNPYIPSFFFNQILRYIYPKSKDRLDATPKGSSWLYSPQAFLLHFLQSVQNLDTLVLSPLWSEIYEQDTIERSIALVRMIRQAEQEKYLVRVEDPESRFQLHSLFGKSFSPSKYASLKQCPARFFWESILKIRIPSESALGFDPMQEGSIMHAILKKVFESLTSEGLALIQNWTEEALEKYINTRLWGIVENEVISRMFHPYKMIREVEIDFFHRVISDFLRRYHQSPVLSPSGTQAKSFEAVSFIPQIFEMMIRPENGICILENPRLLLTGKIDRIDQTPSGFEFLIDYKRSSASAKEMDQLMFYALARNRIQNSQKVVGMGYMIVLPDKKNPKKVTQNLHVWDEETEAYLAYDSRGRRNTRAKDLRMESFVPEMNERIMKVLNGIFTPVSGHIYRCPFSEHGLCQLRSETTKG